VLSPLASPGLTSRVLLVQLGTIVSLWVGLFLLNGWLFERLTFSEHVSWIFLPAALRMIAVLLAGWVGTLGIFLGSLVTCIYVVGLTDPVSILVVSGLSALSPTLALLVCARFWGSQSNLAGLSSLNLLILGIVAASFTAISHNIHFVMMGQVEQVGTSIGAMFIGDLVGTLIVLYGAKALLCLMMPKPTADSAL